MGSNFTPGDGFRGRDPPPDRCFGAGTMQSFEMPDKFLEKIGLYRKNTPLDGTCLFRAVAEQVFDVQLHHDRVRKDCVQYMRANRHVFRKDIQWEFDLYMNNMQLPTTYGTLLELKALAMRYRRNVILYEAYTQGRTMVSGFEDHDPLRTDDEPLRLFKNANQFDSVYRMEFMKTAALCQSIVYNLLYSSVMHIPDVEYAVERMLHHKERACETYFDGTTPIAVLSDGRRMELTQDAAGTRCMLSNPRLCHFHNQGDFVYIKRFFQQHGVAAGCERYLGDQLVKTERLRMVDPLLYDRALSCVHQLIEMKIMPMPYRIAKALDPNIYRNVEYDVWADNRQMMTTSTKMDIRESEAFNKLFNSNITIFEQGKKEGGSEAILCQRFLRCLVSSPKSTIEEEPPGAMMPPAAGEDVRFRAVPAAAPQEPIPMPGGGVYYAHLPQQPNSPPTPALNPLPVCYAYQDQSSMNPFATPQMPVFNQQQGIAGQDQSLMNPFATPQTPVFNQKDPSLWNPFVTPQTPVFNYPQPCAVPVPNWNRFSVPQPPVVTSLPGCATPVAPTLTNPFTVPPSPPVANNLQLNVAPVMKTITDVMFGTVGYPLVGQFLPVNMPPPGFNYPPVRFLQ